jgi:ribosomal protein S18 acetylase RimI-like enzyme
MSEGHPGAITLRPIREEDTGFLQEVYFSTRREELQPVLWPDVQKRAFLLQQFDAQHTDYHRNYPNASYDVIEEDGRTIGRLYVDRRPDELHILDIALLPEHRGRGIGRSLLRTLLAEAHGQGKPVRIYVEHNNRARSLYRRLGFRAIGDTGVYLLMEAPPPG